MSHLPYTVVGLVGDCGTVFHWGCLEPPPPPGKNTKQELVLKILLYNNNRFDCIHPGSDLILRHNEAMYQHLLWQLLINILEQHKILTHSLPST